MNNTIKFTLAALVVLLNPASLMALTFTVNTESDLSDFAPGNFLCETSKNSGTCSLRAAIQEANAHPGADTIIIPAGTYLITLQGSEDNAASGDFDILDSVDIQGANVDTTIIDGNGIDRVFDIFNNATVNLMNLTVKNGKPADQNANGGGIRNAGVLQTTSIKISGNTASACGGLVNTNKATLVYSDVSKNNATSNVSGYGGGACNLQGSLDLFYVNVIDNTSINDGGGVYHASSSGFLTVRNALIGRNQSTNSKGGGIYQQCPQCVTLLNTTTVSGNTAHTQGGGVYSASDQYVDLVFSTIANNHVDVGGQGDGLFFSSGGFTLKNSLLNNATNCVVNGAVVASNGFNVASDSSCGISKTGDVVASPKIGVLQNNGGYSFTHALLEGSPAIDKANNGGSGHSDQRGSYNPGLVADPNDPCDIGAYELGHPALSINISGPVGSLSVNKSSNIILCLAFLKLDFFPANLREV